MLPTHARSLAPQILVSRLLIAYNKLSSMRSPPATFLDDIELSNKHTSGQVEIRHVDETKGYGLVALREFQKGECVIRAKAVEFHDKPDSHTIQTGWHRHVIMDYPALLVNHRCHSANLGIQENDLGAYDFVALTLIKEGEELTWDYVDAEYEMESPFHCMCGDQHCRKMVRGWKYSTDREVSKKDPKYLPKYRQEKRM